FVAAVRRPGVTLFVGATYGLFWWVIGALRLMPIFLSKSHMVLVVDEMQAQSLLGHLLYGLSTSVAMNWLSANATLRDEIRERVRTAQALQELNAGLEQRVQERTAQLETERAQLKAILDGIGEGVIYCEGQRCR